MEIPLRQMAASFGKHRLPAPPSVRYMKSETEKLNLVANEVVYAKCKGTLKPTAQGYNI